MYVPDVSGLKKKTIFWKLAYLDTNTFTRFDHCIKYC